MCDYKLMQRSFKRSDIRLNAPFINDKSLLRNKRNNYDDDDDEKNTTCSINSK